jgi:hypothetical protein
LSIRTRPAPSLESHPLEGVARAIFRARPAQDRVTLAEGLKGDPFGSTHIRPRKGSPKLGMSGDRAYLVVAEDVIGCMASQGKIEKGEDGWYRLVGAEATVEPTEVQACGFRYPTPEDSPETWHSEPVSAQSIVEKIEHYLESQSSWPGAFIISVVPVDRHGVADMRPGPSSTEGKPCDQRQLEFPVSDN